jgi:bifunctional DNase/RNase
MRKEAGVQRVRPGYLVALAFALAAGTVQAVQEWRSLPSREVELSAREIVRCRGGQAVLVLQERAGDRRLIIPVSRADARALEQRLERGAQPTLARRSIDAMGGRIANAFLDSGVDRGFAGRVTISRGLASTELSLEPAEAIVLALDAGAPIRASRDLLDAAGISTDELSSLQANHPAPGARPFKVLEL